MKHDHDNPPNTEPTYEEIELRDNCSESGKGDCLVIKLERNSCYGNASCRIAMNACSAYDTVQHVSQ